MRVRLESTNACYSCQSSFRLWTTGFYRKLVYSNIRPHDLSRSIDKVTRAPYPQVLPMTETSVRETVCHLSEPSLRKAVRLQHTSLSFTSRRLGMLFYHETRRDDPGCSARACTPFLSFVVTHERGWGVTLT